MTDTIRPLSSSKGECPGCTTLINAAHERKEKPPRRGDATWELQRDGKIWWLCSNCAAYSAHVYGIVCAMNPNGAKTIVPQIVRPNQPVVGATT